PGRKSAAFQFLPRFSGIRCLPNSTTWASAVESPGSAAPLVRRGIECLGVRRIHYEIGESRVLIDELDIVPGRTTVRRFVKTTLFVGAKQVTQHSYVNDVWVFRINYDPRNRLRIAQPHI